MPRPLLTSLLLVFALPALAQDARERIRLALLAETRDFQCVSSPDLTAANPDTTPLDNSRPGAATLSAFTPRTDAQALSPEAPHCDWVEKGAAPPPGQSSCAAAHSSTTWRSMAGPSAAPLCSCRNQRGPGHPAVPEESRTLLIERNGAGQFEVHPTNAGYRAMAAAFDAAHQ